MHHSFRRYSLILCFCYGGVYCCLPCITKMSLKIGSKMPEHMIHIICIILIDELSAFIVFLLGLYDKFRAP